MWFITIAHRNRLKCTVTFSLLNWQMKLLLMFACTFHLITHLIDFINFFCVSCYLAWVLRIIEILCIALIYRLKNSKHVLWRLMKIWGFIVSFIVIVIQDHICWFFFFVIWKLFEGCEWFWFIIWNIRKVKRYERLLVCLVLLVFQ